MLKQLPRVMLMAAMILASGAGVSAAEPRVTVTSTAQEQAEVAVTVYNSNVALVRDVRRLRLPAGTLDLRFMDIAARVNPATVHITSLAALRQLNILEQNYEYDLLSPSKLLQKYVGKELTLIRVVTENNTTKEVPVKAVLLADNEGPVWKVGREIVTGMGADRYVFPDLPESLYSKPTLVWLVENKQAGEQTLEASYLTGEVNWTADYVLTLGSDEKSADLNGWVTIVNQSGAAFRNAQLQLVAGELNRVGPLAVPRALAAGRVAAEKAAFEQEAVSEYHLYTLERRTDIRQNESKQISLLATHGAAIEKVFEVDGQPYYYLNANPGQAAREPVKLLVKFGNSEANSLGMPLPAGTMRVYEGDSKGRLQFIGEDRIGHTPKDETVSLHIGNAFDVVAERQQTDYQRLGAHTTELEYRISLRNHKPVPVTVMVNEPISGDWTMLSSNFKFEKTAAFAARFVVPIAADGESELKYRVRVQR